MTEVNEEFGKLGRDFSKMFAEGLEGLKGIVDCYRELQAENKRLKALCWRESQVLKEALKRKHNKSMIAVVAGSLEEAAK